jgi:hypothetical protein
MRSHRKGRLAKNWYHRSLSSAESGGTLKEGVHAELICIQGLSHLPIIQGYNSLFLVPTLQSTMDPGCDSATEYYRGFDPASQRRLLQATI